MTKLARIGIDPGKSNGCISVFENGKIQNFKMAEEFRDIMKILKPFGGAPGDTEIRCSVERMYINPFASAKINANKRSLITNYERIQDALHACEIPFRIIEARTWQKYHQLTLPKGAGEKGLNYEEVEKWKREIKELNIHRSIENKTPNDEIIVDDIRHILETSGSKAARLALGDNFPYFTKYELTTAINETERSISKFYSHEKQVTKNRYYTYICKKLREEGYTEPIYKYHADSLCILLYEIMNPHE